MMDYTLVRATTDDIPAIWKLLQQGIARRKMEGSKQWQDGYPNPQVVKNDIEKEAGYVMVKGNSLVGYFAILLNDEPEYSNIDGEWITNDDFVVFHRIAIDESHLGQGLAKKILTFIEEYALSKQVYSIKADTNFDNLAMLKTFQSTGYVYCGEVYFRGSARKAFEKVLKKERTA